MTSHTFQAAEELKTLLQQAAPEATYSVRAYGEVRVVVEGDFPLPLTKSAKADLKAAYLVFCDSQGASYTVGTLNFGTSFVSVSLYPPEDVRPVDPRTGKPYANEAQFIWDTLQGFSDNENRIASYFKTSCYLFTHTAELLGYSPVVLKRLVKKGVLVEGFLKDGYMVSDLFHSHLCF